MICLRKFENRAINDTFRGGKQGSSAEAVLDFSIFHVSFISATEQLFLNAND